MSSFFRFRLFIFIWTFTGPGDSSDGSEIEASVEDFSPVN